jgi:retinol-binding protein 3
MKSHLFLLLALLAALPTAAQPGATPLPALDAARRAAIVDSVTAAIDTVYVFPEVAHAMAADARARLAAGEYDAIARPEAFAERLTADLRAISHDLHLSVRAELPPPAAERDDPAQARRRDQERARRSNYGFTKLEHLAGNIGYLKLDGFSGDPEAGPTAVAAMNFLAHNDAIIIDLTENGGGSPSMIQLLTSYLLDEPTHLNSFYIRATGDTQQFWSLPWVPGPRLAGTPVYVLTSRRTFSAAEEFTYNLKNLERATIVGETTGGGAHPVEGRQFDFGAYVVTMSLPFGRAVNPITGTNWEGTGIEPHLACAADQALDTAYLQALKTLAATSDDSQRRFEWTWARDGLVARREPVNLPTKQLDAFAGSYGVRQVRREGDRLIYQRGQNPPLTMIPMSDDTFRVAETENFRMGFERDDHGRVVRLVGMYADGRTDTNERDR